VNFGKQMRKTLFAALAVSALSALWAALANLPRAAAQSEISSFAFVQEDGSLKISGSLVRLYGIYIPPTDQTCNTFIRPVPCGTRASLALDFKISGAFVHCLPRATHPDGSITASCTVDREDLSAWMLQRGWAVALPDAPFEYRTLEKIAQSRGIGIWGIPVETLRRR
jgi:endonuclease YncB( thermonuclease family)